ncbi:MAG: thioredoxin family protein [Eubacterium aggregans]|uniref:thioredoxin family protein n=1 Tax=Eubacterium aggregans TaxID=81409 RepID=UPI0023F38BFB|nr:thioredoxin family protein [Eubacterium aggregans]MDD4691548.1 thioredoxin family protein [Eubacterium aggregans]MEA5074468.1 thioredoxin family protein [Eubacterium aggregans]
MGFFNRTKNEKKNYATDKQDPVSIQSDTSGVLDIKILGPGCRNCQALLKNTETAVERLGLSAHFEKVTDYQRMADFGIMSTPGLVVNGSLLINGQVPSDKEIENLILAHTLN